MRGKYCLYHCDGHGHCHLVMTKILHIRQQIPLTLYMANARLHILRNYALYLTDKHNFAKSFISCNKTEYKYCGAKYNAGK